MIPKFRGIIHEEKEHGSEWYTGFEPYEGDLDKYHIWLDSFKPGDHVFFTVEKITKRKERSLEQNAYYWGVIIKILSEEIGYTKDEMHEALRYKFLRYENVNGLPTFLSTTQLSTVEWECYMEEVRRWASMDMGIVIPEPNQSKFVD